MGPLSIEAKKRVVTRRSKLEKNQEDQRKPQEIREEDITRSENETTKNVATVRDIWAFTIVAKKKKLIRCIDSTNS